MHVKQVYSLRFPPFILCSIILLCQIFYQSFFDDIFAEENIYVMGFGNSSRVTHVAQLAHLVYSYPNDMIIYCIRNIRFFTFPATFSV